MRHAGRQYIGFAALRQLLFALNNPDNWSNQVPLSRSDEATIKKWKHDPGNKEAMVRAAGVFIADDMEFAHEKESGTNMLKRRGQKKTKKRGEKSLCIGAPNIECCFATKLSCLGLRARRQDNSKYCMICNPQTDFWKKRARTTECLRIWKTHGKAEIFDKLIAKIPPERHNYFKKQSSVIRPTPKGLAKVNISSKGSKSKVKDIVFPSKREQSPKTTSD